MVSFGPPVARTHVSDGTSLAMLGLRHLVAIIV